MVIVRLMAMGRSWMVDSMSRVEAWGGDMTWRGQVVLESQWESCGVEALRRGTEVAIPKDIIEVSTSGEDATCRVSGGNSMISWADRLDFSTVRGEGKSVSLIVVRVGRSPSKCFVFIERRE